MSIITDLQARIRALQDAMWVERMAQAFIDLSVWESDDFAQWEQELVEK